MSFSIKYWVGQKVCLVIFNAMALVALSCFHLKQFCIVLWQLHYKCTLFKKNISKLLNFCAAILILNMEENTQHFWHIVLYYFKKGKTATEVQEKICAMYGEVLWLIELAKSDLQTFGICWLSFWYCWHFGQIIVCCGAVLCTGRCLAAPRPLPIRNQ